LTVQRHDLQVPEVILEQLLISDVSGLLERVNLFQDEIVDFSLEAGFAPAKPL